MRHCGALRIDHVMGLARVFWMPLADDAVAARGRPTAPTSRYPLEDLLGIVALESQRNHCLVIGEDLGTVPERLPPAPAPPRRARPIGPSSSSAATTATSSRRPSTRAQALVAVSTHDLPTLNGFWQGRDLDLRRALGPLSLTNEARRQLIVTAPRTARAC